MNISLVLYYVIAVLSIINFARIFMMLISSDIYDIRAMFANKNNKTKCRYTPLISIIIPAYNEEMGVIRTIQSVLSNTYKNKEIIVVNDGSSDRTLKMLRNFQRQNPGKFVIVNQSNSGKASAINRAVKYWSKGKLVMVVDADSLLHKDAIANMVSHFRNPKIMASSANVKILPSKSILGISQQVEYLISYRLKRALTVLKMEYIIGGVGSTFRRSMILKCGLYDTDTMTEDIDLTLKMIKLFGNRKYKVNYAADAVAYTEHVMTFRSLIKQRFRWKYGRMQSLLKNKGLFFSRDARYSRGLSWYQLPYAIFGEISLFLEPLLVGYILYVAVRYVDIMSIAFVYVAVTIFITLVVLGENSESARSKIAVSLVLPIMYICMYLLTVVELAALLKSLKLSKKLFNKEITESSWTHVERSGLPINVNLIK